MTDKTQTIQTNAIPKPTASKRIRISILRISTAKLNNTQKQTKMNTQQYTTIQEEESDEDGHTTTKKT